MHFSRDRFPRYGPLTCPERGLHHFWSRAGCHLSSAAVHGGHQVIPMWAANLMSQGSRAGLQATWGRVDCHTGNSEKERVGSRWHQQGLSHFMVDYEPMEPLHRGQTVPNRNMPFLMGKEGGWKQQRGVRGHWGKTGNGQDGLFWTAPWDCMPLDDIDCVRFIFGTGTLFFLWLKLEKDLFLVMNTEVWWFIVFIKEIPKIRLCSLAVQEPGEFYLSLILSFQVEISKRQKEEGIKASLERSVPALRPGCGDVRTRPRSHRAC